MKDNVFKYDVELAKQVCASMGLTWNDNPDYSQEPKASELFRAKHYITVEEIGIARKESE